MRGEKAPARPVVPPPLPRAAHSPPLRTCSLRTHPGTGSRAVARESRDQKVYLTRSKLGRAGLGAQPPLSPGLPPEDRSSLLGDSSSLPPFRSLQGSANAAEPPPRTGPPPLRRPAGRAAGGGRRARRGPWSRLRPARGTGPHHCVLFFRGRREGGRSAPPARGIRAAGCGLLVCSSLGDLYHTREGDRNRLGSWELPRQEPSRASPW